MEIKALSVTQLGTYVKNIFDAEEMLHDINVFGEISGFSVTRDIAYFTLKDENALLSCVLFGASRFPTIKNGDSVILTGTPRFYVKGGKLNFNVSKVSPYGQGQLYLQFLQLKEKLEKEGLFDASHKIEIPQDVKRIGVVTSEGGAVIQDIINVSSRRDPMVNIVLYPVKVQGVDAEKEIAKGINFFSDYDVDVVIVARGGGSLEDLQPYNTEIVARATYECKKPIVSAVGHETDFTIIDFVSDLRAPTPSAAAELVCVDRVSQTALYKKLYSNFKLCFDRFMQNKQSALELRAIRLEKGAEKVVSGGKMKLNSLISRLNSATMNMYNDKIYSLGVVEKTLKSLNPIDVLKRGFAKVEIDGKSIESVEDVEIGSEIVTYLKDGKITAKTSSVERRKYEF